MAKKQKKKPLRKNISDTTWTSKDKRWLVKAGKLTPTPGHPEKVKSLFSLVAEKIPFEALDAVAKDIKTRHLKGEGVYVAHDSMGYARYVGRGNVIGRLRARYKAYPDELVYFSFYIVANKKHERETETLLIRIGGANLQFNSRKKRVDIDPGNIRDYEPGTRFYERQQPRGKKAKKKK